MKYITTICGALLLAGGCGMPPNESGDVVEARHGHFRWTGLGVDHNDITESALQYVDGDVADDIGDYNEETDSGTTQLLSRFHVDNCYITEAFQSMRARYDTVIAAMNPDAPNTLQALMMWGSILHTAQDFYSHTNWVEGRQTTLFDFGSFDMPIPEVRTRLGTMMVATEALPDSFLVELAPGSRVPTISIGGAPPSEIALISGVFSHNLEPSICPIGASINHGPMFDQGSYGSFLAKDDPDSPHHAEAYVAALAQTKEELCRFSRLVMLQHGEPGHDFLLATLKTTVANQDSQCPDTRGMVAAVFNAAL
jgi:hypothetical protein